MLFTKSLTTSRKDLYIDQGPGAGKLGYVIRLRLNTTWAGWCPADMFLLIECVINYNSGTKIIIFSCKIEILFLVVFFLFWELIIFFISCNTWNTNPVSTKYQPGPVSSNNLHSDSTSPQKKPIFLAYENNQNFLKNMY